MTIWKEFGNCERCDHLQGVIDGIQKTLDVEPEPEPEPTTTIQIGTGCRSGSTVDWTGYHYFEVPVGMEVEWVQWMIGVVNEFHDKALEEGRWKE